MADGWGILRNQMENPVDPTDVHAHEKRQMGDATTYQTALIAALVDEIITEDEWSMLDVMRRVMGIQPEEHALIEEAVRAMASNVENGESFVSRLDRYVTLHPYRYSHPYGMRSNPHDRGGVSGNRCAHSMLPFFWSV